MRYNPALDGLRAVAISFVIVFHSNIALFPGGRIGVDVFFVLSGYLITSILADEMHRTGEINFRNFYIRRALRLTPALLVLVAFQLARSPLRPDGSEIRYATLVGATYLENWNAIFRFAPFSIMAHTWSLATEEQFYLLWPITLIFIIKRRRPLVWIYAGLLAMMIARLALFDNAQQLTYALYARPVGLLVGCALAFVPLSAWPRLPRAATLSAGVALLALGAIYTGYDGMFAVFFPLLGSIAAATIIVACVQGEASILGAAPIAYVGRISYGLYLYSFPLVVIGEHWKLPLPTLVSSIGMVALSFAAAALSYELIEKPFLRLKGRLGERQTLPVAVAARDQRSELTALQRLTAPTSHCNSS